LKTDLPVEEDEEEEREECDKCGEMVLSERIVADDGGVFCDLCYGSDAEDEEEVEPKIELKVEAGIHMSELAEYHNALAGRRPRGAIAFYENKYPQLKTHKRRRDVEAQ